MQKHEADAALRADVKMAENHRRNFEFMKWNSLREPAVLYIMGNANSELAGLLMWEGGLWTNFAQSSGKRESMQISRSVCAAAIAAIGLAGAASAAEYVVNGGFETGDFTGWTQFGDTSFTGVGNLAGPHSGNNEAIFGSVVGVGGITQQVIPVSAGSTVNISFWIANPFGGTPNFFSADFDGTNLATYTDAGAFGYTQVSLSNYVVTNNNPTITFSFYQFPAYFTLDDVSITSVPLPSAAGLGLAGLLGLGARRRRA